MSRRYAVFGRFLIYPIQHTTKLLKHVRAFPSYHFHVEAWDFYHNNTFLQTQYYIFVG